MQYGNEEPLKKEISLAKTKYGVVLRVGGVGQSHAPAKTALATSLSMAIRLL